MIRYRKDISHEERATIRALQAPPAEVPSIDDRIARIDRELDEIRKQARA